VASRLLRRSGIACGLVAASLDWRPRAIYHIGVGDNHQEVDVLTEEWPGVEWFGCEPHPDIYRNAAGCYPGRLYNVAITSEVGIASLRNKKHHRDGSTLYPTDDYVGNDIQVTTTTLDTLFVEQEGHPRPDSLLWLDCEGCELLALVGGQRLLSGVEMVNVEAMADPPNAKWCSSTQIHARLSASGYWLQWIHTQRIYVGQVDFVYVSKKLFRPGLCCIPHEIERFRCEESAT
jgi:FkbM family methyltransferase